MSSIVIHIRFTEEILAHACDGMEHLQLPPPTALNDIVRTAVSAGLAVMVGHDWIHKSPTHSGYERVRALTKQPMRARPADLVMAALSRDIVAPSSIWENIPITETIYELPLDDQPNANKVWKLMYEGHVSINDQLTCNDGTVDRLAAYLLWHHKEHFPDDLKLIEQVYNEYHKGD